MLQPSDIVRKSAQVSFFGDPGNLSFYDLVQKIRDDRGLTAQERLDLIRQLNTLLGGSSESTPLSDLLRKGGGGILGAVLAKYFGAGIVGQLLGAAAGYGTGGMFSRHQDKYPGYRMLG